MAFDVDALIAEAENEPFVFTYDGTEYELPHGKTLTMRQQLDLAGAGGDAGGFVDVLREVAPDTVDAMLDMPGHATLAVIKAWNEHSGIDQGESSASTDSSKSTERPSSGTSTRTTANRSARRSQAKKAR